MDGALTACSHGPGVVISLEDTLAEGGRAVLGGRRGGGARPPSARGSIASSAASAGTATPPPAADRNRASAVHRQSFQPIFRERSRVGDPLPAWKSARAKLHTQIGHDRRPSSGGEIEDTADGKTIVNRWKRGDVEFESSARAIRHATSAARRRGAGRAQPQ